MATADDESFRKVELQSPADLLYLRDKLLARAREKVDAAIPPRPPSLLGVKDPVGSGPGAGATEDDVRTRVLELVEKFVQDLFKLASHSVTLSGVDANGVDWGNGDGAALVEGQLMWQFRLQEIGICPPSLAAMTSFAAISVVGHSLTPYHSLLGRI